MAAAKEPLLRRVHALFLVMLAVTLAVAVAAVRTIDRAVRSSDWVNQTHGLIYELDRMVGSLQTGEGRLRTYALTGNAEDLAAARAELGAVLDHLGVARAVLKDDPAAGPALATLERLARQRLEFADAVGAAGERADAEQLRTLVRRDASGAGPADFRREVDRLRDRQFELLGERDRESYRQAQDTRWAVGAGAAANLLLALGIAWLVRDDLAHRRRLAAALEAANAALEQRVQERTAELTATNRRLVAENRAHRWTGLSQEHQLRYHQMIVNAVSDLVLVLSKARTVTRINPAVAQATGLDEEAVLGQPLARLVEVTDPGGAEALERALRDGRELAVGVRLVGRDGPWRDARLTLLPLRDQDQVVGGIAIIHLARS
jgi:PAS domain S-box-containing protein